MTSEPATSGAKGMVRRFQLPAGNYVSPGWLMTISILQIIATLVFASLFFITHDLHQISTCVLFLKNMGYAQYSFISLGVLIAATIYQSILCLESLYQRRASCLYAALGFQLWLAAYSGIQSYQHPVIMNEAASCHKDAQVTNDDPLATYSLLGTTSVCFLLELGLAIYLRHTFHQSLNPVHAALESFLKLDFYLFFAYGVQLLPLPLMMADDGPMLGIVELVLIFGVSCLLFLLAWSMVLVTWSPLPWWRILLNMVGLGLLCLGSLIYLCYRLVRFMLDPRTLILRVALIFSSLVLIVALLLTMSIVTTCAAHQWQTRHLQSARSDEERKRLRAQPREEEVTRDDDSALAYITPQSSRIV